MKLRYALLGAAAAALVIPVVAYPQGAGTLVQIIMNGLVVSSSNPLPVDVSSVTGNLGPVRTLGVDGTNKAAVNGLGQLAVNASVSASISGFSPADSGARGTPVSVTTSDSSGSLPAGGGAGAVVIVSNTGTTNPMFCNVNGVAATTSDQLITANGGWFAFTIPATITTLHCIATGGTTTANMLAGSGIPTGTGGGSGGGGGGSSAITSWGGGTLGAMANYGTSPGAVLVPGMNAFVTNTVANNVAQINGVTPLMGNGVTGTGSQRVTIASDNTPFAVNAVESGTWNITNISGTVSLPTGASTSALQTTGNTSLSTIATNTTGASTAANQTSIIGSKGAGTAAASAALMGGVFNTVAPSLTNGQQAAMQLDASGNLNVNIKAGAGSGGTALADQATFTQGTTSETPMGCLFNGSYASGTTGKSTVVSCTAAGSVHTTVDNVNANISNNADAVAASTNNVSPVGNFGFMFNGSTFDRIRGDTTNGLWVNVKNATAPGQTTASASSPVVLASDQTAADACMFRNKTNLAISQNGTSSVQLIALSGSTTIYVCSLSLIAAGATTVAITTGTGTACVTGNAAVIGTTTSSIANSMSLAANGGLTLGNGQGTIAKGAASSELCMILGTNVFVSGNLTYVQL